MLSIHNRTTSQVLIAIALVAIFAGSGCELRRSAVPVNDVPANGTTDTTEDTGTGGTDSVEPSITWTTYESPTLGLRVPYPEGWKAFTKQDGRVVDFYSSTPPAMSDAPSDFWSETQPNDIDTALSSFLDIFEQTSVTRNGKTMIRIIYPYDAIAAPDIRMVAYLWEGDGVTNMLGGPEESPIVEYAIEHVEVR
ncbi:MAG: hypothetical protein Q7S96_01295 [bacterium]|nr:hypothetical protein [bacterium]